MLVLCKPLDLFCFLRRGDENPAHERLIAAFCSVESAVAETMRSNAGLGRVNAGFSTFINLHSLTVAVPMAADPNQRV
jgi:hypothetical protein